VIFFFQAEDGIRDFHVTGVQTCALPISLTPAQISVGKLNNVREAITIAGVVRGILGGDGITSEFPVMRHMANLESVRTYEGTDRSEERRVGNESTSQWSTIEART